MIIYLQSLDIIIIFFLNNLPHSFKQKIAMRYKLLSNTKHPKPSSNSDVQYFMIVFSIFIKKILTSNVKEVVKLINTNFLLFYLYLKFIIAS